MADTSAANTAPLKLAPGQLVSTSADSKTVVIQLSYPERTFVDPTLYGPAVPGVIVALAGLWMAHHLSVLRDRRKEIRDLCNDLKKSASEAAEVAVAAWLIPKGDKTRSKAIHETKRKLQQVGITATYISARAQKIVLTQEVAELRRAATVDPFEDPERDADEKAIGPIHVTLAALLHAVEAGFGKQYK